MLAVEAALRPESDGEQGSVIGKPSDWYVLPSVSLRPLLPECGARGSGLPWVIGTTTYVLWSILVFLEDRYSIEGTMIPW